MMTMSEREIGREQAMLVLNDWRGEFVAIQVVIDRGDGFGAILLDVRDRLLAPEDVGPTKLNLHRHEDPRAGLVYHLGEGTALDIESPPIDRFILREFQGGKALTVHLRSGIHVMIGRMEVDDERADA
jgi:hypothetical protein